MLIFLSTHTHFFCYLLLMREPRIIKLSSMVAMVSDVLSPLKRSSPRVLKFAKINVLLSHSAITCFNFCSMSLSFTALMQISFWINRMSKQALNGSSLQYTDLTYISFNTSKGGEQLFIKWEDIQTYKHRS